MELAKILSLSQNVGSGAVAAAFHAELCSNQFGWTILSL